MAQKEPAARPTPVTDATHRQRPSGMPAHRYHRPAPVFLPDRTWPDRVIEHAPRWLSTDLRDGNQALIDPMSPARKRAMFDLLVRLGYKEIEVGFPSASQAEYTFVRSLIEQDAIPDDVTISVLTQSREPLIARTVEALTGIRQATVHLYNATSPLFRDVVFKAGKGEVTSIAATGTRLVMKHAERVLGDDTVLGFEYSPEMFVGTELDFALEVCEAVMDAWQPAAGREVILNLPSTVEMSTPNVYADQIEWMSRNLSRREFVCLSAHPHNDRGTGVASAEQAMLAGVDRVEGCLFGQGERTGNVDLVTLALNLLSHGVDPQVDLSDLPEVSRVYRYCNQMSVPERHPYGGDLVFTSFSGSHQDAIKKGFEAQEAAAARAGRPVGQQPWAVPYLPIDPRDVGRSYQAVIRVNSQSGKGGIAYLLKQHHGLDLPRRMQIEFAGVVQARTDANGGEVPAAQIWADFQDEYRLGVTDPVTVLGLPPETHDVHALVGTLSDHGVQVRVLDRVTHPRAGGDGATCYLECTVDGTPTWGVATEDDPERAAAHALLRAVLRRRDVVAAPPRRLPTAVLLPVPARAA